MNGNSKIIKTIAPTIEMIEEVITKGDPKGFLGFEETSFFEVRGQSYLTKSKESIQAEIAKKDLSIDVSSISNSGGGYIVIGLSMKKKENTLVEYVTKVAPVPTDHLQMDSWIRVIKNRTSSSLSFGQINHGEIGGVFWMKIPSAKELGVYPVIVTTKQFIEGKPISGEWFAMYKRDGDHNQLQSVSEVEKILKKQADKNDVLVRTIYEQNQTILERLDRVDTSIEVDGGEVTTDAFLEELSEKDDEPLGFFYITATPNRPVTFKNFWKKNQEDSLFDLLKNPPRLRRMGWDLGVASSEWPHPKGDSWEITNGKRKILQVSSSGEIRAAISIAHVLNWGTDNFINKEQHDCLVNELAMIEYIYNFFLFIFTGKPFKAIENEYTINYGFTTNNKIRAGLLRAERISIANFYTPMGLLGKTRRWKDQYDSEVLPQVIAARMALNISNGGFAVDDYPIQVTDDENGTPIVNIESYKQILG